MKTAMQELIEKLKDVKDSNPFINMTLQLSIEYAESLLETEKIQIVNAHNRGIQEYDISFGGIDYYIETYKNE